MKCSARMLISDKKVRVLDLVSLHAPLIFLKSF